MTPDYPAVGSLIYHTPFGEDLAFRTATPVAGRVLVTAAHCVVRISSHEEGTYGALCEPKLGRITFVDSAGREFPIDTDNRRAYVPGQTYQQLADPALGCTGGARDSDYYQFRHGEDIALLGLVAGDTPPAGSPYPLWIPTAPVEPTLMQPGDSGGPLLVVDGGQTYIAGTNQAFGELRTAGQCPAGHPDACNAGEQWYAYWSSVPANAAFLKPALECAQSDYDCDGVPNDTDNCPSVPNLDQANWNIDYELEHNSPDKSSQGNACDRSPVARAYEGHPEIGFSASTYLTCNKYTDPADLAACAARRYRYEMELSTTWSKGDSSDTETVATTGMRYCICVDEAGAPILDVATRKNLGCRIANRDFALPEAASADDQYTVWHRQTLYQGEAEVTSDGAIPCGTTGSSLAQLDVTGTAATVISRAFPDDVVDALVRTPSLLWVSPSDPGEFFGSSFPLSIAVDRSLGTLSAALQPSEDGTIRLAGAGRPRLASMVQLSSTASLGPLAYSRVRGEVAQLDASDPLGALDTLRVTPVFFGSPSERLLEPAALRPSVGYAAAYTFDDRRLWTVASLHNDPTCPWPKRGCRYLMGIDSVTGRIEVVRRLMPELRKFWLTVSERNELVMVAAPDKEPWHVVAVFAAERTDLPAGAEVIGLSRRNGQAVGPARVSGGALVQLEAGPGRRPKLGRNDPSRYHVEVTALGEVRGAIQGQCFQPAQGH